MEPLEAGLSFALELVGAEAGALLLSDPQEHLIVVAERMWATGRMTASEELWRRAQSGVRGALLASPVLALPVEIAGRLSGMLCVQLPERTAAAPARVDDLGVLAGMLVTLAASGPRPRPRPGLALIHEAADPATALKRLLDTARGNVSQLARDLGCTRKAIYAAAERYHVRLAQRAGPR